MLLSAGTYPASETPPWAASYHLSLGAQLKALTIAVSTRGFAKGFLSFPGAAGASLLLAGCSIAGGVTNSAPNALDRGSSSTAPIWELAVEPIAQPVVADGVALVYAKDKDGLKALAVSMDDGKELWSRPIHPGIGAPGIELEPEITKSASGVSAAVFLQAAAAPANNSGITWWTAPVAVDLKTGKEIYRGETQLVDSRPAACEDEKDVCFTSMAPATGESVEHRVDLSAGTERSGTEVNPLTGNFRLVGDGLYSVVENRTESLARVSDGKKLWAVDVQSLFGPGATTNFGWTFQYSRKLDLYVGTVGTNPTTETDYTKLMKNGFTVDLTTRKTVGFRASTGEVLWTADGAESWCSSSLGKSATKLENGSGLPVRCEYTQGTQKIPGGTYENAMAKLVGYDPLTGKAGWQTEPTVVTDSTKLLLPTAGRGDTVLAGTSDGPKLISTEDGKSRAATPDDVFLCSTAAKYPLPVNPPFPALPKDNMGSGGDTSFPCDKDGNKVTAVTEGTLRDIDAHDNGITVLAMTSKVSGYKLTQ